MIASFKNYIEIFKKLLDRGVNSYSNKKISMLFGSQL